MGWIASRPSPARSLVPPATLRAGYVSEEFLKNAKSLSVRATAMSDSQQSDQQPEAELLAEATEKRRGPRYPFDLGEVLVATHQGRSQIAMVSDVSADGIGLLFDEVPNLEIGQEATVTGGSAPKAGVVRHVTPYEPGGYFVGFEWITAEG